MSKKPQYDPAEIRFPDQHIAACQDQIRLCEQKLAKGNPCFLYAGEGIDLLGKFIFRKSKPF